jgi:major outer membrane protein P.IB
VFHYEMGVAPNKADGFNVRASGAHPGGGAPGTTAYEATQGYTVNQNRQSFVGLTGGFGTIRAGYLITTGYVLTSFSGLAASEMPGHRQNAALLSSRSEAIQYTSPNLNGLTLAVQIGQGDTNMGNEAKTSGSVSYRNERSLNSVNAVYSAGPLYVGVDYATGSQQSYSSTAGSNNNSRDEDAMHLGVRYDLGVARAAFVYGDRTVKGTPTSTSKTDTTTNALTVFVPLGAFEPFVQYGTTEIKTAGAVANDITGQVFGARYNISKRTLAYVMHGTAKDDKVLATTAHKETRTVVGLSHSF